MLIIDEDKTIHLNRGDIASISVGGVAGNEKHTFQKGDIIQLKVFEKNDYKKVLLQKEVEVQEDADTVDIFLSAEETSIGEIKSKPMDYHYQIRLNPDTAPQMIVGNHKDGAKLFKLYPEGGELG